MTDQRRQIDIEPLLRWTYQDELPKKFTSSAEGIWDSIQAIGERGGIGTDHGAAQRYAHFGLPHPDAIIIEKAVANLRDYPLDWESEAEAILGDLFAIVEPREPRIRPAEPARRVSKIGWGNGPFRVHELVQPPRPINWICEVMMRPAVLVTMHARMGTRPDWFNEWPKPEKVMAERGQYPKLVGECLGKNVYREGSHNLIEWLPSISSIAEDRADYLAWHRGLCQLAETLNRGFFHLDEMLELSGHVVLPPAAPEMPWRNPQASPNVIAMPRPAMGRLPLNPQRPTMGPPLRMPRAGKVRGLAT